MGGRRISKSPRLAATIIFWRSTSLCRSAPEIPSSLKTCVTCQPRMAWQLYNRKI